MLAKDLLRFIIRPTLEAIGHGGPAAEELILGTAVKESGLIYLHQVGGPALGFWQIEPKTATWLLDTGGRLTPIVRGWMGGLTLEDAMMGNLFVGAALARMRYLKSPSALPAAGDLEGQARLWKAVYNTPAGRGTEAEYLAAWRGMFPRGFAP